MIVVPLVLTSLVTGVTGTGSLQGLGRLGWRTFAYYMGTSMLAILVGIVMVNTIRPGVGADLKTLQSTAADATLVQQISGEGQSVWAALWNLVVRLIPANPIKALVEADMLQVIVFSLLVGIFIVAVGGRAREVLTELFESGFKMMMAMTMFVIRLAPVGVLGFMLYASAGEGLSVFVSLAWYMLTVFLGLVIHATITLPLLLWLLARRSPYRYARDMSPALLTAFSTASSNGTLPVTINCVEERAGISNRISSFVLPLGATINMDGTALYEAVAALFIAQAMGHDLSVAQQITVALAALLASVGAAAIPHAGIVMMVIVLGAVGLPVEAVGLILAVDRILDMCRTTVNVWSDSTAAAVVARFEPSEETAQDTKYIAKN
jgi:proton glutamate symport protein